MTSFLTGSAAGTGPALTLSAWIILFILLTLSVLALTVTFVKFAQFAAKGVGRGRQAERAIERWLAGDGNGALELAEPQNTIRLRVLYAALSALKAFPSDKDYSRELATQAALQELAGLARWMRALDATVQAAPMLGLLGTVLGMINAFANLSETGGTADPSVLAAGIWTALLTTAAGLSVALVFYFISVWLDGRITRERQALDYLISSFIHGRVGVHPPKRKV